MDDDVFEALLLPFGGNVLGQLVITLGSGDVGLLGEDAVLAAFFVGAWDGLESRFDLGFAGRGRGREAEDLGAGLRE